MTPNPERRPKVLCVDDEPPLLRSLRWLLRREFDVAVASSGREALALLAADRFDVVLSDQRMPGMCGSEFLSLAQQVSPLTVRLLLTGYADFSAVVAALNEGDVFRYISKPWDDDKLIRCVQEAARLSRVSRLAWSDFADTVSEAGPSDPRHEVLLVQPDADFARACAEACGNKVPRQPCLLMAQDLADALTLLSQRAPAAMVLQQQGDPRGTVELVRAIRRKRRRMPVVLASDSHDIQALQQLINEGLIHRYLYLPADSGHIARTIVSAVDQHLRRGPLSRHLSMPHASVPVQASTTPAPAATTGALTRRPRWLANWLPPAWRERRGG